ncbi:MAG: hypothetical protein WC389_18380 [Lutibacter sp.]
MMNLEKIKSKNYVVTLMASHKDDKTKNWLFEDMDELKNNLEDDNLYFLNKLPISKLRIIKKYIRHEITWLNNITPTI